MAVLVINYAASFKTNLFFFSGQPKTGGDGAKKGLIYNSEPGGVCTRFKNTF